MTENDISHVFKDAIPDDPGTAGWGNKVPREHRRRRVAGALEASFVAQHPMVRSELALGGFLALVSNLPQVQAATHAEVMSLVEENGLHGQGLSLVDAHLLAATLLTPETRLWTRDVKLRHVSRDLGVEHDSA